MKVFASHDLNYLLSIPALGSMLLLMLQQPAILCFVQARWYFEIVVQ
jgi:hypothetical protein